jgi:hypothetical protein
MTYLGLLKAFSNIHPFFSFNLSYLQCVFSHVFPSKMAITLEGCDPSSLSKEQPGVCAVRHRVRGL